MSTMSAKKWYLVYTKPRQERIAKLNLNRQQYQVYLPMTQRRQRRNGTYQLITEPFFPRYLFIALSEAHDNWSPIRSTRGVMRLVEFGGMPAQIPLALVDYLREKEHTENNDVAVLPAFSEGEAVHVVEGVFAGYRGIFAANAGKRVSVLLNIADKTTKILLSPHDIMQTD